MRIDIVTIFPEFFAVLDLSLLGKARQTGLIDVRVHDLRDFTHDRHRTVDDTPYGGGAGMVMKPEPWGEALDAIVGDGASDALLVVPVARRRALHAGDRARARRRGAPRVRLRALRGHRPARLRPHADALRVRLVSLGDYVLNGGEVAAMAMIEAVGRLVPGVVGNPESLVEESHEDGLLEYPTYTKPAVWREPRGAAGAAARQPRGDRRMAARAAARAHRAGCAPSSSAAEARAARLDAGSSAPVRSGLVRRSSRVGNTWVSPRNTPCIGSASSPIRNLISL